MNKRIWMGLAAIVLLAAAPNAQNPPPAGVVVAVDRDPPTWRALLLRLKEALPSTRFVEVDATGRAVAAKGPRIRDLVGRTGFLALGAGAETTLKKMSRGRLVAVRAGFRPGADRTEPGVTRLWLAPPAEAVGEALSLFLPQVQALGVMGDIPEIPLPKGVKLVRVARKGEKHERALLETWAPLLDALLLPDLEALAPRAEEVAAAARKQGVPVVTTAGWLCRSGVTLGVLPDLDLWSLRICAALGARGYAGRAPLPPARILLVVDAPFFGRRKPSLTALLRVDRVLGRPAWSRRVPAYP